MVDVPIDNYSAPLEFLLGELRTRRLVIAGPETDQAALDLMRAHLDADVRRR
jgi:hypothetical protein